MNSSCFLIENIPLADTQYCGNFGAVQVINIDKLENFTAFVRKRFYFFREHTQHLGIDNFIFFIHLHLLQVLYLFVYRPLFLKESQIVDAGIPASDEQKGPYIIKTLKSIAHWKSDGISVMGPAGPFLPNR